MKYGPGKDPEMRLATSEFQRCILARWSASLTSIRTQLSLICSGQGYSNFQGYIPFPCQDMEYKISWNPTRSLTPYYTSGRAQDTIYRPIYFESNEESTVCCLLDRCMGNRPREAQLKDVWNTDTCRSMR